MSGLFFHNASIAQTTAPVSDIFAPPLLQRTTNISFNASETYDNNVARSSEALAILRGIQREDEISSPNADVDVVRTYGLTSLYLTGSGGYQFYNHDHILNRQTLTLLAGAVRQIERCQAQAVGTVASGQADLEEFRTLTRENLKDLRTLYTVGGKASCRVASSLMPTVSVKHTVSDNSQAIEKLTDYDSTTVDAGLGYVRGSGSQASLYSEFQTTTFPDRPLIYGGSTGFQVYGGGISYQRPIGAKLKLATSLGYIDASSGGEAAASHTNFSGPNYSVQLNYSSLNRLAASITAYRQINPSTLIGSTYSVDDYVVAQIDYVANSLYTASLGYSELQRAYKGAVPILAPTDVYSRERIQAVYSDVSYNLSRRFNVKFDARWEQRRADVGLYNYDDGRFTVTFGASF